MVRLTEEYEKFRRNPKANERAEPTPPPREEKKTKNRWAAFKEQVKAKQEEELMEQIMAEKSTDIQLEIATALETPAFKMPNETRFTTLVPINFDVDVFNSDAFHAMHTADLIHQLTMLQQEADKSADLGPSVIPPATVQEEERAQAEAKAQQMRNDVYVNHYSALALGIGIHHVLDHFRRNRKLEGNNMTIINIMARIESALFDYAICPKDIFEERIMITNLKNLIDRLKPSIEEFFTGEYVELKREELQRGRREASFVVNVVQLQDIDLDLNLKDALGSINKLINQLTVIYNDTYRIIAEYQAEFQASYTIDHIDWMMRIRGMVQKIAPLVYERMVLTPMIFLEERWVIQYYRRGQHKGYLIDTKWLLPGQETELRTSTTKVSMEGRSETQSVLESESNEEELRNRAEQMRQENSSNSKDYSEYLDTTEAQQDYLEASVEAKVGYGPASVSAGVDAGTATQSTENVGNSMSTSEEVALETMENALTDHVNKYCAAKETQLTEAQEKVTEEEQTESSRTTFANPSPHANLLIHLYRPIDEYDVYFSIERSVFIFANGGIRETFTMNEIDKLCSQYINSDAPNVKEQLENIKKAPVIDYAGRKIPRDVPFDSYRAILRQKNLERAVDYKIPMDVDGVVKKCKKLFMPGQGLISESHIELLMDEYQERAAEAKVSVQEAAAHMAWMNAGMQEDIREYAASIPGKERAAFYQWMKSDEEILSKLILHRDLNPEGGYVESAFKASKGTTEN